MSELLIKSLKFTMIFSPLVITVLWATVFLIDALKGREYYPAFINFFAILFVVRLMLLIVIVELSK